MIFRERVMLNSKRNERMFNMEQILEMNEANQLTIPSSIAESLDLKPGAHFTAREEAGRFIIEYVPFSSLKQAESLNQTVKSLQKEE